MSNKKNDVTYWSSSDYKIVGSDGEQFEGYMNNLEYAYNNDDNKLYYKTIEKNNHPYTVTIEFRDGEKAVYKNAYDLQDFLYQVNHYHDLEKAFNIVVNKLLECKPELDEWIKKNFDVYIKNNIDN